MKAQKLHMAHKNGGQIAVEYLPDEQRSQPVPRLSISQLAQRAAKCLPVRINGSEEPFKILELNFHTSKYQVPSVKLVALACERNFYGEYEPNQTIIKPFTEPIFPYDKLGSVQPTRSSAELFAQLIGPVDGRFGAPHGRQSYGARTGQKTYDRRVPIDSGGYDRGGAYWGIGNQVRVEYSATLDYVRFYRT